MNEAKKKALIKIYTRKAIPLIITFLLSTLLIR